MTNKTPGDFSAFIAFWICRLYRIDGTQNLTADLIQREAFDIARHHKIGAHYSGNTVPGFQPGIVRRFVKDPEFFYLANKALAN